MVDLNKDINQITSEIPDKCKNCACRECGCTGNGKSLEQRVREIDSYAFRCSMMNFLTTLSLVIILELFTYAMRVSIISKGFDTVQTMTIMVPLTLLDALFIAVLMKNILDVLAEIPAFKIGALEIKKMLKSKLLKRYKE